jgi:predicted P-loop ATPase
MQPSNTPTTENLIAVAATKTIKGKGGAYAQLYLKPHRTQGYRVLELRAALERHYGTDAHFMTAIAWRDGAEVTTQTRLVKWDPEHADNTLADLREHGIDVLHSVEAYDIDVAEHKSMTPERIESARALLAQFEHIGWYTTAHGLRVLRVRDGWMNPETYEREVLKFLRRLQRAFLESEGWVVDFKCTDWTRNFRLPYVRRTGVPDYQVVMELGRMEAIPLPAIMVDADEEATCGEPWDAGPAEVDQARAKVAAMTPPPCGGSECDAALWLVALVLHGYAVPELEAVEIAMTWAARSDHTPAWAREQVARKVTDAMHGKVPRGFRIGMDDEDEFTPEDVEEFCAPWSRAGAEPDDNDAPDVEPEPDAPAAANPATPPAAGEPSTKRQPQADMEWAERLLRTRKGEIRKCAENVRRVLTQDARFVGRFGFDDFMQRPVWRGAAPWVDRFPDAASVVKGTALVPVDIARLGMEMSRIGFDASEKATSEGLMAVALQHRGHVVRDYLEGLKWDGVPRLDAWLVDYFGAVPDEEDEHIEVDASGETYSDAVRVSWVGRAWLVQAVRRVMEPGSHAKYVLCLEGAQDIGKSSALRALASPPWFMESAIRIESGHADMVFQRKWIAELAEAALLRKASREALKAYLSIQTSTVEPKYANLSIDVARQIVFALTTNDRKYLNDPSGGVRFWPVHCHKADFAAIERDRDHLWAEAVVAFRTGESTVPVGVVAALSALAVSERAREDPWGPVIEDYIGRKNELSATDVSSLLEDALKIEPGRQTQYDRERLGDVLSALCFEKRRGVVKGDRGKRPTVYVRNVVVPIGRAKSGKPKV